MSPKARARVGGLVGITVLIAVMVVGYAVGIGAILTLPIAVVAAALAHLAITRGAG